MDSVLTIGFVVSLLALLAALLFFAMDRREPGCGFLVWGLAVAAVEVGLAGLSAAALLPEHMLDWQRVRLLVSALLPGPWLALSLIYARGNYREFLRLWRGPIILMMLVPPLVAALAWSHLVVGVRMEVDRLYWPMELGRPALLLLGVEIIGAGLVLMNVERTLREARGTMRWRVKYFVAGVAVIFVARLFVQGQAMLNRAIHPVLEPLPALALAVGCLMLLLARRRSQRLHVDLYVSTRMAFGSMAVLLAGAYLAALGLTAHFIADQDGEGGVLVRSGILLAGLALLLLLVLSDRVRVVARRLVTRHLRRPSFDYRQLWHVFSERTLPAQHPADLARAVTGLVSDTFDVLSVSLWLLEEDRRLRLGSSTALTGASIAASVPAPVLEELARLDAPVDLDLARGDWVEWLRRTNPAHFREGGHRHGMALRASGELVGFITMGDRVNGLPFTLEELELFKILGDQTATRLLALRLAERRLAAQQVEAFQLMSAFLVHDLKNTASSLTLTLQNLPVYFNDATFREDARRTIASGVGKMNETIRRLSTLRQKMEIRPREVAFREWFSETLRGLENQAPGALRWVDGPDRTLRFDPEQMQGVVTNLVLNARDASAAGQSVEISAECREGIAVISVRDQGAGMSADFVEQRLFRPFQTTKAAGLGIGLFQSRMIVEAHGGRIEVESQPGQGSTFRVWFPA